MKNHIDSAKQLSKLDHENLHLKIEGWKKESPESLHYCRPYIKSHQNHDDKSESSQVQSSRSSSTKEVAKGSCEGCTQTILWVHQEY